MTINLPTGLTLLRICLVPLVAAVLCVDFPGRDQIAAGGFALALISDWLDGWLARRWHQESEFGAFLDPVADKLIVCTVLVLLVYQDPRLPVVLPVAIIVGRELAVSGLREWMAERGARSEVAVGVAGKYKTSIQMIAILVMLADLSQPRAGFYDFGLMLLGVGALLTVWSMIQYLRAAWPRLRAPARRAP